MDHDRHDDDRMADRLDDRLDADRLDADRTAADRIDDQDGTISDSLDPLDHMAENFGLDAAPGTKGVKASGAGLSGDVTGNSLSGSNDPDTYRDAPSSGAKTGGAGL